MQKKNNLYRSIVRTLCYSDVFDYPLKKNELFKFLNTRLKLNKKNLSAVLSSMLKAEYIEERKGYYCLAGRKKIIMTRIERKKYSNKKLKIAKKVAGILSYIPTVKLIGISGSLSLGNALREDDIDFFIITERDSLWVTRFLVNLLLIATGNKRSRHDSRGMNLICPNLFIAQDQLSLSIKRRNLFSAREIVQLRVLFDRDNSYEKFLKANLWLREYLPNITIPKTKETDFNDNKFIGFIDKIFYAFQFLYMSNRITGEEIKQNQAFFHPEDKGKIILKIYRMRYEKYSKDILQDIDNKPPILYI